MVNSLRTIMDFIRSAISTTWNSKRKSFLLNVSYIIDADPVFDEDKNLINVTGVRVRKTTLAFEKNTNLVSRTFKTGTWVALGEHLTVLLKGISKEGRNNATHVIADLLKLFETKYDLKLVGNRYLDQFSYVDGIKRATLLFAKEGPASIAAELSMHLFGQECSIKDNDSVKFMNYTWAGLQTRFCRMMCNFRYSPIHKGGTDGAGFTTLSYIMSISADLAKEIQESGTHLIKQQGFTMVDGYICPVKGTWVIAYSRKEWDTLDTGVAYDDALSSVVVSENEVKLVPSTVELGKTYPGTFGIISLSGETTLNRPFWKSNAQLLARTDWSDASIGIDLAKNLTTKKLSALKTKEGYLGAILHLSAGDVQDSTWNATRISASTIAGQLTAGLPFSAFETVNNENIAMRELKRALKGIIGSLSRIKIPGSYFYPIVDSRLVSDWEVGIGTDHAAELSRRWKTKTKITNDTLLMVQRSPHIGSGYLWVKVKLIDNLGWFDGIVISPKCASFLGADCDGDRVSLSLPMLGKTMNPAQFPDVKHAAVFMKKIKIPATGNTVLDRLIAATIGRQIGMVDWLMTKLHEDSGSLTDEVLAFGAHISQEVISSSKHIGEDIIDLESISDAVNPVTTFEQGGKKVSFRKTISFFYRFVTCKLKSENNETYESFRDRKGNIPCLPKAYASTPLKGIYDALMETGVSPFWNTYDMSADKKEWDRMLDSAKSIAKGIKPAALKLFGWEDLDVRNYAWHYIKNIAKRTPGLEEARTLLSNHQAQEARESLRKLFDRKKEELGDKYPGYLVHFWARVWSSGFAFRSLMMTLTMAECAIVVRAIKTWTSDKGIDWTDLANWSRKHQIETADASIESEDDSAGLFFGGEE